ncbi:hypothetical protein CHU93_07550 [Sandarakinorhabdus cyanobacteriorum]|uniref:Methylamine utilization protein MauE n=1 Tax=Sandarakinorhabdus cyanobacteriorum TaxID=1981098 RepID=A0A255YK56_9SPHN|nr:MauE/DoxX family redox-associated membrane protein [Sandarakinorhabdus cyanobacteriorum]OYQ29563.1 hypothetical protein CHU93_07550 [Sandarakinorhabdus cyanobacteriorum]
MALDPTLLLSVRFGAALLFATAAWHKVVGWPRITGVIAAYRLAPERASTVIAALLVGLEIGAALAAALSPVGLYGAAALLLLYAGAIGLNMWRGNRFIDCGCLGFARGRPQLKPAMVVRNMALAGVALVAATQSAQARPLVWIDYLSVAGCLLCGALIYAALEVAMALPAKDARS